MPRLPSATPSPHRFLVGQRKGGKKFKELKPASALRKEIGDGKSAQPRPAAPVERKDVPNQFASTPRFIPGQPNAAARSPSPPKTARNAFRPPGNGSEEVDEAPSQEDGGDDEMLDDERMNAVATTELDDQQWKQDIAFSPKRRRIEQPATNTATPFKRPEQPASNIRGSVAPFASPQPFLHQATPSGDTSTPHRPVFLRPSAPPPEASEPLPETFSPHKRGQKFVPGGMAATGQQWVIETGQAAVQSRRGQGYLRGDDYVTRVTLDQIVGHGAFTARGRTANGEHVDLLLAGRTGTDGEARDLVTGSFVGIRAPTWEMELGGTRWTVAVDWKMLS